VTAWVLLQIVLSIVVGNALEWILHKYVLHGLGSSPKSSLSFHWIRHHRFVRRNKFSDPDYLQPWYDWNSRTKEIACLVGMSVLVLPIFMVAPVFYGGLVFWTFLYYNLHKLSHLYPSFGKKYLRWHYDHHMGTNQHSNWCVVIPLWDYILGTRVKYEEDSNGRLHESKTYR